jgi:hypothetical protein
VRKSPRQNEAPTAHNNAFLELEWMNLSGIADSIGAAVKVGL